jgi:hypothetical protein
MEEFVEFVAKDGTKSTAIHVLITRFNMNWKATAKTAEWMEHRIRLFKRFCLPSVREQTTKKFHWLILLGEKTLEADEKKIAEAVSSCAFPVNLVRTPDCLSMIPAYDQAVSEYLSQFTAEWVIASRVDNDDVLGMSYMERVQREFTGQEKIVRTLLGYMVKKEDLGTFVLAGERGGPFLSIHSRISSNLNTGGDHSSVNRRSSGKHKSALIPGTTIPVVYITDPLWIQVIHARNIGNRWPPVHKINPKNLFSVDQIRPDFFEVELWNA